MRVRSRPGERRWRSAGIAQAARLPFLYGTATLAAYAGAMNSVQKEGAVALFAMTLGRGIMIRDIVCPHVRWVGRPWVVISKTLGTPASGLETASPPAWFPWVPGGGLQIRHIIHIQIVARGEAGRRSFGCAASVCLGDTMRRVRCKLC